MKQKIKIRQGIFETNSSSSHSFSMGPEGRFNSTLVMDKNGIIDVGSDLWEDITKTNDSETKLSYLLSFAWTIAGSSRYKRTKYKEKIYKVVKDFTGATQINFKPVSNVDHQSLDIIDPRDLVDPEFIKEFIFNPETWLYLLWDSEIVYDDFYEKPNPLLDKLYTIQFDLPGIDKKDSRLTLSYREVDSINSVVYIFLFDNFVFDSFKKIFLKKVNDEALKTDRFWTYKGNLKFSHNDSNKAEKSHIKIAPPKIEIAK